MITKEIVDNGEFSHDDVYELIDRIAELEKALSDLIERAAQRGSGKYFPESYLDEAFKVLLKEQGK